MQANGQYKITRVVGTMDGVNGKPGDIIEPNAVVDAEILQKESGPICFADGEGEQPFLIQSGWELTKREITRFSIEGKAQVSVVKTVDGERTVVDNAKDVYVGDAYSGKLEFVIRPEERIVGLGQQEAGVSNYRNTTQYLYQNNMKIPMPVFLSTAGYAVLLDADCTMIYEEYQNQITIRFDAVEQIAYYVIRSQDRKALVQGLRSLTGKAEMLPAWAYGYVQSKERYRSQEDILATAEEFKKRDIPISCMVQDWLYWGEGKWGDKHMDPKRYPDMKTAVRKLHDQGIALMVSVWPNINKGGADNEEMMEAGKLLANLSTYDAFDPEARALYWKQCERELFAMGTDAWWCDSTEPFTPDWNGSEKRPEEERYQLAKEALTKYMDARKANAYALYHAKGIYENQRQADPDRRVVNLTRSGYPSIQKYGTILWSGDIMATWDVLKHQLVEGVQMAASGIPYWTLDIGAFFTGNLNAWKRWSGTKEGTQPWFWNGDYEDGVADKGYCELYVRWLQYGTFLPIMRSHGTDTPREPWNFEAAGSIYYDTIVKYIRLRYHLVPYIYSLAYQVYRNNDMMMRGLLFDYTDDEKAAEITDEYLFGDFLVCPVTFPVDYGPNSSEVNQYPVRKVYLPKADNWYDYESKSYSRGGQELSAPAPIDKMPLYIRSGSILPVADGAGTNLYEKQEAEEIALEIYTGKDGAFTCYFDRGNGYEYQQGEYAAVTVVWKEEASEVILSKVEGDYSYPRSWKITCYTPDGSVKQEAEYHGEELRLEIKR